MEYWEVEAKADEWYKRGDFERSLEYYSDALNNTPDDHQRRFAVVNLYVGKARSHLGLGDARAALATLEDLAEDDTEGIYMSYPEYFGTLIESQKCLGIDSRNAENQLLELELDWIVSLKRAYDLLRDKQYEESLTYFERSISLNPYEWYSLDMLNGAYRGKAAAMKKLGRYDDAEACLRKIPPGD